MIAQDFYIEEHTKAVVLLQRLEEALYDMPAPDGETQIDWGHVGSIKEVNQQIEQLIAFARGEER